MKQFPCIESTEDIVVGNFIIRLWINEEKVKQDYDNSELVKLARDYYYNNTKLVKELAKYPQVNAIQIKDMSAENHSGVKVYYENNQD